MAFTESEIVELYVATFNRAPDAAGLNYWMGEGTPATTATTVIEVANAMLASSEMTATYPASQTTSQFIEAMYQNLFGRSADAAGLAYWKDKIDGTNTAGNNATKETIPKGNMIKALIDGAKASTGSTTDATILANKTAVGTAFADAGINDVTQAKSIMSGVTADTTTKDAAIATLTETAKTLVFSDKIDILSGTGLDDTFIGDSASISAGDQVNGGAGIDTLKVFGSTETLPTLSNVEKIYAKGINAAYDVASTGITALELDGVDVSVTDIALKISDTTALTLTGVTGATSNNLEVTTTDATNLNLTVNKVGSSTKDLEIDAKSANLTSVSVTSTGDKNYIGLENTGAKVKTLNVAGDTQLTVAVTAGDTDALTSLTVVDASAMTAGGLVVNLADSGANTKITGSAGDDKITATAGVNYTVDLGAGDDKFTTSDTSGELTSDDTINGGAGTDTLSVAAAEALGLDDDTTADKAILAKVTNFEVLELTDALTASLSLGNLGFNAINLTNGTAATTSAITDVTSGVTVTYSEAASATTDELTVTMKDATLAGTTNDTLNVNFHANLTANATFDYGDIKVSGINKVNFNTKDSDNDDKATDSEDGYSIGLESASNVDTITVTGTNALTYTLAGGEGSLATFDASASTGAITFVGTSHDGSQGITIKTAGEKDTITSTAKGDLITTGASTDAIIITDDTALTTITDFTTGASGDNITFDVSAIGSQLINGNAANESGSTNAIVIEEISAKETVVAGENMFVLTGATYASTSEVKAAIVVGGAREITLSSSATANDDILVAYSNGTDSYISTVNINNGATTIDNDAATTVANIVKLTGVNVSTAGTLDAANFAAFV